MKIMLRIIANIYPLHNITTKYST